MEFWGVEVKNGPSLSVDPGEGMIMHISQVALGKNETTENESVQVYLKVGYQKLLMGTLSHDKFPNLSTKIVLEKGFELSHSWKNGSVYFTGYKVDAYESDDDGTSDDDEVAVAKGGGVRQVNFQLPNQDVKAMQDDDDDDDDESDNDTSSDDDSEETSSSDDSEAEEVVVAEALNDEEAEDDSSHDDEDDSAAENDDDDDSADDDGDDSSAEDDDDDDSSDDDGDDSGEENRKKVYDR